MFNIVSFCTVKIVHTQSSHSTLVIWPTCTVYFPYRRKVRAKWAAHRIALSVAIAKCSWAPLLGAVTVASPVLAVGVQLLYSGLLHRLPEAKVRIATHTTHQLYVSSSLRLLLLRMLGPDTFLGYNGDSADITDQDLRALATPVAHCMSKPKGFTPVIKFSFDGPNGHPNLTLLSRMEY